ncbi:MAG: Asp-tRNA(Asn)/Glu-tRNA(Gln) amidotransferase subunit GatC [Patescibacteria group bacterium]
MKLSQQEVEHIASLARLKLSQEEKEKYGEQLSAILDYMEKLQEVATDNIEPTSQVTGLANIMREDEIKESGIAAGLLGCSPENDSEMIKIPKIFTDK